MYRNSSRRNYFFIKIWTGLLLLVGLCLSCNNSNRNETSAVAENPSEAAEDSVYVVEVTAADYAFGMPSEVPSGWVTFRMKNMGQEVHNAVIQKYADTMTYKSLAGMISETLRQGNDSYLPRAEKPMGGPAMLSPGLTGETTVFLEPGVYAMYCFMVAEDGEVHFRKGMTRPFRVTEEKSGADEPKGNVDVLVSDLAIDIKDPVEAGDQIFSVHFETPKNVHLAKLDEDQDLDDLKRWMTKINAPAPFTFLGGAEEAEAGLRNTFRAHLEPGRYALATYYFAEVGMAEEFVIPENGAANPVSNEPVNPPVTLKVTTEETGIPHEIPAGRTVVTLEATEEKQGIYVLSRLKEGRSMEEFRQFAEDAFHGRANPYDKESPFHVMWGGPVSSDEGKTLYLEIEDATYVLTGPVPQEDEPSKQWKGDEMFHIFRGSENSTGMAGN